MDPGALQALLPKLLQQYCRYGVCSRRLGGHVCMLDATRPGAPAWTPKPPAPSTLVLLPCALRCLCHPDSLSLKASASNGGGAWIQIVATPLARLASVPLSLPLSHLLDLGVAPELPSQPPTHAASPLARRASLPARWDDHGDGRAGERQGARAGVYAGGQRVQRACV